MAAASWPPASRRGFLRLSADRVLPLVVHARKEHRHRIDERILQVRRQQGAHYNDDDADRLWDASLPVIGYTTCSGCWRSRTAC